MNVFGTLKRLVAAGRRQKEELQVMYLQYAVLGILPIAGIDNPEAKDDALNVIKPIYNWVVGNIKGVAPYLAAASVLVLGAALIVSARSEEKASKHIGAMKNVIVGLVVVIFGVAVVSMISDVPTTVEKPK